jgi:hypothetical protein
MNPLNAVMRELGVGPVALSAITKIPLDRIHIALADPPGDDLATAFQLLNAVGARLKLRQTDPICWSFDAAWLDGLYRDNDFRRDVGLIEYPASVRHLAESLRARRKKTKESFELIAATMERNYIPTAMGMREWRKSGVFKMMHRHRTDTPTGRHPIVAAEPFMEMWRPTVVEILLTNLCPHDSMAAIRYGLTSERADGRVTIRSPHKILEAPRYWIQNWLDTRSWLVGRWESR